MTPETAAPSDLTLHMSWPQLERLNREGLLARLYLTAVHDGRNILQRVAGMAALLPRTASDRLVQRSEQLLAAVVALDTRISRLQALLDTAAPGPASVAVRPAIEQVVSLRASTWGHRGVRHQITGTDGRVAMPGNHLIGLLLNVLLRAEDRLGCGSGSLSMTVSVHDHRVQITVDDDGQMPAAVGTPAAACDDGYGVVGSALVISHLVQVGGGHISHGRTPMGGTRVVVDLPAA